MNAILLQCPACAGKVSSTARACPHCGHTDIAGRNFTPEKTVATNSYLRPVLIALCIIGAGAWWVDKIQREKKAARMEQEAFAEQMRQRERDAMSGRRPPVEVRVVK